MPYVFRAKEKIIIFGTIMIYFSPILDKQKPLKNFFAPISSNFIQMRFFYESHCATLLHNYVSQTSCTKINKTCAKKISNKNEYDWCKNFLKGRKESFSE